MIKNIPKWRWFAIIILLFGSALSSFSYLAYNSPIPPTLYELLLIQINTEITFKLLLIFLLISGDLCFGAESKNYLIDLSPVKKALHSLRAATVLCLLFFGIMIITSIVAYLLCASFTLNFTNRWITIGDITSHVLTPLSATSISLLLTFLRFVVFSMIIQTINIKTKYPLGFIGAFVVCLLDAFVCFNLRVERPVGFLPFEHSYLGMVVKLSSSIYMSVIYSVLYWLLLSLVVLVVLALTIRTKKNITKVADV